MPSGSRNDHQDIHGNKFFPLKDLLGDQKFKFLHNNTSICKIVCFR